MYVDFRRVVDSRDERAQNQVCVFTRLVVELELYWKELLLDFDFIFIYHKQNKVKNNEYE